MHRIINLDEDVQLRTWSLEDAEALHTAINENADHLRQWLPWVEERSELPAVKEFIHQTQLAMLSHRNHFFGIWYRGKLAGEIANHDTTNRHRRTTISYWLQEKFQGNGLITRSARHLIAHFFNEMDINRVELRVAEGNERSLAIPRKLGFRREGKLLQVEWLYDRFVDHVVFGLLYEEWIARERVVGP